MKLQRFISHPQYSMLKGWLWNLVIGSCLLTIGNNPQRQQLVSGEVTVADKLAVIQLGREVISSVIETWALVDDVGHQQEKILQRMVQISDKISGSEQEIFVTANFTFDILLKQLTMETRLKEELLELFDLMNRISYQDRKMRSYLEPTEKEEQLMLEEIARRTVSQEAQSVLELVAQVDLLVAGPRDLPFRRPGLLEQLLHASEATKSTLCNIGLSMQQVLYYLYNAVSISEIKGYSKIQFSWMLLKKYGKGNFNAEANLMRRRFEDHTNRTRSLLQQVMAQASRECWRCDLEGTQHREGDTFLQITRLLQGYVVNEVDLNANETCRNDCAFYNSDKGDTQEHCYDQRYCPRQTRCSGKIYNCEYIHRDMRICPAHKASSRRYEFIEFDDTAGTVLGQKKQCQTIDVLSWRRWFYRCSYCFCLCDDTYSSDRHINLRESVSDVENNKVVTGLRFVKRKRVIYLIVQQGTLLPQGQIDNTTLEWVEPEVYDVLSKKYLNGRDYHTLTYDNRTMDLDDIVLQPFHVLTGVRFRMLGTHMNLQARMTKMDFGTGKLVDPDLSIWVGNDNAENKRLELTLEQPHVPILSTPKSIPNSITNQYIRFRESDRNLDASQTTVPFFDAQSVVPTRMTALGGCGILHKGLPKFGGYVAPKVFTYDYGSHV